MIKVHISPDYLDKTDNADGGIRRVSEAMIRYLPEFGVEHVRLPSDADIIITHGAMLTWHPGKPIINANHGLYWSRQAWGANFQQVNEQVVEAMCRAVAHTAPSEWVATAIRRGGFFYPEVVYHGVDADKFSPAPAHGNFVLWNKARADYVSDPTDLMRVAGTMLDTEFRTTIGRETENVKVLGLSPYNEMKRIVAHAGVYLCTARETFGIGTLEALASGVPVAGWDWGGQSEIIVQGVTGYLAPPGDFDALRECIQMCFRDRERLSANAIADVRQRWGWEPRIKQYANLIDRVYHNYILTERPKVSVIVTAYKLDQYLPDCLSSVMGQTFRDFECLVVDDANLPSTKMIVDEFTRRDQRIRYCPTPTNLGLPGARNYGLSQSSGHYIRHLDADDMFVENTLTLEAEALDKNPGIHIVYGHMESVRDDGSQFIERGQVLRGGWPPEKFSWIEQMSHLNNIPSCAMARREVYERSGGYRTRMYRNEDAEFWCRVTSLGFRAKKITQASIYLHRQREDSKGSLEWKTEGGEPDWTAWFPWRVGATNYQDAVKILRQHAGNHPSPHLVPFGAQGRPAPMRDNQNPFWYVHDYAYPIVSVIVTCGPGHRPFLLDALDSVQAQTFPDWECIVVNDTGDAWPPDIIGAPYAKVVNMDRNRGASAARNAGYSVARGKYIVWMDADDYWFPWFLEILMAHAEKNHGVLYGDAIFYGDDGFKVYRYADFVPERSAQGMQYAGTSVMIPRDIADKVFELQGGWDLEIPGMEDWDFQVAMHSLGFCAYHIPEPIFVYRTTTSTKRLSDYAKIDSIREYMDRKWYKYRVGGEPMPCGCGGIKPNTSKPFSTLSSSGNFDLAQGVNQGDNQIQMVRVEYIGPLQESFSISSRVDRRIKYRFGNNEHHRERTVFMADAEHLISLMDGEGKPTYRMISGRAAIENRDPVAFLGKPVTA